MIYTCLYRAFKYGPILKSKWDTETGLVRGVDKAAFFYQNPPLAQEYGKFLKKFEPASDDIALMYEVLSYNQDSMFVVMVNYSTYYYVLEDRAIDYLRKTNIAKGEGNIFECSRTHIGFLKTVPLNFSHQVYPYRLYVYETATGKKAITAEGQRPIIFHYDKDENVNGMGLVALSKTDDSVVGYYMSNGKAELLYKL